MAFLMAAGSEGQAAVMVFRSDSGSGGSVGAEMWPPLVPI